MIPMMAIVNVHSRPLVLEAGLCERRPRAVRLWLPLFLIWLVLLPFALLLAPFLLVALAVMGRRPIAIFAGLFGLLAALSGTRIEVNSPQAAVFIHIF
jgi:uncharacterized membrane protein